MTDDEKWALTEAAKESGFCPNEHSVKEMLVGLEISRLVRRSDVAPVWHITHEGRKALAESN